MPTLTRASLERLKLAANLVDVVSSVVKLQRVGKSYKGLSPFSQEKTPSFYVHPDRGFFKCFSTGTAGDAIRFVELTEKLTFMEAVEVLAERFHVELEYEGGRGPTEGERSLRRELLEIHEAAASYYRERFWAEDEHGRWIRRYWTETRRFAAEVAKDVGIGFAPPADPTLTERLRKIASPEALKQCGLFFSSENDPHAKRLVQRFRGRLMIPIRDTQGQVVAFTARQLELTPQDDPTREAKYVNSPSTPLFDKGRIVFGLERARVALDKLPEPERRFMLVEGQLDTIRCWTHGLSTTVAPQGTAVTEDQLRLLKRYCERLDCVLDGDSAGQKAALRLLPLAWAQGLQIRFRPLTGGDDPDSLLLRGGASAFGAIPVLGPVPFALRALAGGESPSSLEATRKAAVFRQFCEILAEVESATAREGHLNEAAQVLAIDRRAAAADFQAVVGARHRRAPEPPSATLAARSIPLTTAEDTLLYAVLHHEELVAPIASIAAVEWLDADRPSGILLRRALLLAQEGAWEGAAHAPELADGEDQRNLVFTVLAEDLGWEDPFREADQALKALHERHLRVEQKRIEAGLASLASGDPRANDLLADLARLRQRRRNIPSLVA